METTETRQRFAEAAHHVIQLQEQLEAYKSALDHISDAARSSAEVSNASNKLTSALEGTADLLGEELLTEIEALRKRLVEVRAQAESTEQVLASVGQDLAGSIRENVSQEVLNLRGTLTGVVSEYRREFGRGLGQIRTMSAVTVGLLSLVLLAFLFRGCSDNSGSAPSAVQLQNAQVQILNGVGESGLARTLRDNIQAEGVSVVNVGNIPNPDYISTELYFHSNAYDAAVSLAELLGIPASRVYPGPPAPGGADITVVIGGDYSSLPAFTQR